MEDAYTLENHRVRPLYATTQASSMPPIQINVFQQWNALSVESFYSPTGFVPLSYAMREGRRRQEEHSKPQLIA